ncbi:MAG: hypothetical protein ACE5NG_02340 [bacterium]
MDGPTVLEEQVAIANVLVQAFLHWFFTLAAQDKQQETRSLLLFHAASANLDNGC